MGCSMQSKASFKTNLLNGGVYFTNESDFKTPSPRYFEIVQYVFGLYFDKMAFSAPRLVSSKQKI
jgi:hypothetical protein